MRFQGLVQRAKQQTGKGAVIILDEYDAPLLHLEGGSDEFKLVQKILREFYITCKACSEYLRFVPNIAIIHSATRRKNLAIFRLERINSH